MRERWRRSPKGQVYLARYQKSEKRKTVLRRYYESGKGKATIKKYQATPKGIEALARGVHKRRANIALTVCDLTAQEWENIKGRQDNLCAICGEMKPLTRDHIIPLKRRGQHTATNIQALCRSCNSKKTDI